MPQRPKPKYDEAMRMIAAAIGIDSYSKLPKVFPKKDDDLVWPLKQGIERDLWSWAGRSGALPGRFLRAVAAYRDTKRYRRAERRTKGKLYLLSRRVWKPKPVKVDPPAKAKAPAKQVKVAPTRKPAETLDFPKPKAPAPLAPIPKDFEAVLCHIVSYAPQQNSPRGWQSAGVMLSRSMKKPALTAYKGFIARVLNQERAKESNDRVVKMRIGRLIAAQMAVNSALKESDHGEPPAERKARA